MIFSVDLMKKINYISDPQISPDGKAAAAVTTTACEADGKFYPQIRLYDTLTGEEMACVFPGHARQPRYSADGSLLACLSDASGEYQIWCIGTGKNAKPRQITSLRHGVRYFTFLPDASGFIFEADIRNDEDRKLALTEMSPEEKKQWLEQQEYAPVEITQIDYKRDEYKGMRPDCRSSIGEAMISGEQRLFECEIPLGMPAVSADGSRIACYGQPYTGAFYSKQELFMFRRPDDNTIKIDDCLVQLTKGKTVSADAPPCFCNDGEEVVYPAYYSDNNGRMIQYLYKTACVKESEEQCLFDPEAKEVSSGVYGTPGCRTQYGDNSPFFTVSGDKAYFVCAFMGTENLYSIELKKGSVPELILSGDYSVHEFCLPVNGRILVSRGDYQTLKDLYIYDMKNENWSRLCDSNPWLKECTLGRILEFNETTKDGKAVVYGRVCMPAEYVPGRKYPAVLYIHGGPTVCYTNDFWHEVQVLSGAGFAVVFCDPRGSFGYGLKFADMEDSWGKPAYEDLMQILDAAVAMGFIDEERIGITGGSYGGYETCKIIMQSSRFKAAVAQRTFVNKATSYGTGDMGFYSASMDYSRVNIKKCLLQRARTSIIKNVDRITTPLLLLHGYADYRCSFEQSEQMFIAMKQRCPEVPVRLVMFPGENHGVSRTGLLHFQQRHVQEMTDWFIRYLEEADKTKEGEGSNEKK